MNAKDWATGTIEDAVGVNGVFSDGDWVESKDQDPDGEVRLIQLADIGDGWFRDRSSRFLTSAKAEELGCTYLKPGDVLIARMPDPLGRACIFPDIGQSAVTAVDVCIVRPGQDMAYTRWLMHMVNSPEFRVRVAELQSGTTRKRISRKNLATIGLPLPPIDEQRRIVAAIETHLSHLDAGVESLERAKRNAELLWAAVLDRALETTDMETLESFADPSGITDGPFGSNLKTSHYTDSGPRVLRLQNIGRGEFVDDRAHISREHFESLRKHEAEPGDLLVASLYGDQLRSCVVPDDVGPAIVKADCIRIRPSETSDVHFLAYALQRPQVDQWCAERVRGVGRQRLGLKNIRSIPIPDFDPAGQHRVASEIASIESNLDHVIEEIVEAQSRAEGLRRGVLAAAFSGQLGRDQEVIRV